MVEQQLFDVHAHLTIKRAELEFVASQIFAARMQAQKASARVAQAETPIAQRQFATARRRLTDLEQLHEETAREVGRLVRDQDALLSKLLG